MASAMPRSPDHVPPVALRAAAALVVGAILAIGAARLGGVTPAATPPVSAPAAERALVIIPHADGGARVTDAVTGVLVADLDPLGAGFIAGVDRALARIRMQNGLDRDLPVRLVRWQDGRFSLIDPASGWRMELQGFGPDNLEAFARLLDPGSRQEGDRP